MKIIFTDLDGTLLDHETYSFHSAENALRLIKKGNIPLIICTSKTRAEIEYWNDVLSNHHPFIAENGGGIFIPKTYFPFEILHDFSTDNYDVIELGTKKGLVHETMNDLIKKFHIKSFLDMSAEEIAQDADLPIDQAKRAKQREYSIPFKILDNDQIDAVIQEIRDRDLQYTVGGRYYHLIGDVDKGEATKTLLYLLKKRTESMTTSIGIGDSENDFPMLDIVDQPYLVKRKDGSYASDNYPHADGIGPDGWQEIIQKELEE